ncbi:MAG: uL30 family ribosomal protein, partial [Nanoarchaeota archaeon]|nr:uL30 family ribosomal protein [Nanoarchaeota archaeon]
MEEKSKTKGTNERLAIIRIRGVTGIKHDIKQTLDMLNLYRKNNCAIVPKTDAFLGMCKKVKDFT